jgi:hypothetical protein
MKKICIFMFALMSTVVGFAQLYEVKGVETKLVVYDGSEYKVEAGRSQSGNSHYKYSTKWFGYSFYNMNSIPVSVEAELYYLHEGQSLVTTKNFNLKPGETYIWKHENMDSFKVNYEDCVTLFCYNDWTESKKEPNYPNYGDGRITYYVKYKAYKIL